MTICTGSQIRAARALLGWSRQVLAEAASLHVNTVVYWEQQEEIPTGVYSEPHACRLIQQALVKAGVVFLSSPAPGVRFCQKTPICGPVRAPARARVMGSKRLEIEKDNFVRRYGGHALDTHTNAPTPPSNDRRKSECGAKTSAGHPCRRRGTVGADAASIMAALARDRRRPRDDGALPRRSDGDGFATSKAKAEERSPCGGDEGAPSDKKYPSEAKGRTGARP